MGEGGRGENREGLATGVDGDDTGRGARRGGLGAVGTGFGATGVGLSTGRATGFCLGTSGLGATGVGLGIGLLGIRYSSYCATILLFCPDVNRVRQLLSLV